MKKNKGYTLVELLVSMVVLMMVLTEVYVVMSNGSNVYNKGSYDVSLQTKAQQALMHLEDILIDANESVSYDSAGVIGDNGKLTIVNEPGDDYMITFDNSDPVGQLYGYGRLMLTVTKDDGTVLPAVPLVDNVATYRVVTDEIDHKTGDSVFINLSMSNKECNYTAQTKEVYLRNRLGTRGNDDTDDDSTPSANFTLNVLRYKDYPLNGNRYYFLIEGTDALGNPTTTKKYCNYFVWQSSDGLSGLDQTEDPNSKYALVGNASVKCNAGMNLKSNWDESATAVIRGYEDVNAYNSTPNKFITITVVTDKVGVGTSDYDDSAGYINFCSGTSQAGSCLTRILGISVEEADSVDYTLRSCNKQVIHADSNPGVVLKTNRGSGDDIRFENVSETSSYNSDVLSTADGSITSGAVIFAQDITEGHDIEITPDNVLAGDPYPQIKGKVYVYLDGDTNSFASYSKTHQTNNEVYKFDDENKMFYLDCKIKYSGGTGQYLEFPVFFLYTGEVTSGGNSMNKILYEWANLDEQ
ncbi:MAG: prepilin-type N-terminal cleavage/methylation domain-containing protein [Lachnospiraceae bacterium]|nr:prepilin-type N-terminal cleavage/methylation domain-containing protein [Lachnospiraceae bacterium]